MNPALYSTPIAIRRKDASGWHYGALGIIALFTAILIIRWHALPVFLDIYYHASCMMGFKDAGGIVLHDFWEYAPAGRPHLYPPLFHIILLGLNKSGLPVLFIIRLVSAAIYPLLLLAILWVITKLYNDRRAFFTVLAASLPYTFFLNTIAAIPATIVLIIMVLLFYALETRRTLCGVLLLGLAFYAHGGLPWLAILAFAFYAILRRENRREIIVVILGGILLGSPWLIYMAVNKGYFLAVNNYINRYFEANVLLYIFAALGASIALRQRGRSLFFLTMLAGMAPMIKNYTFRFLCGEGLLPLIFLAGIGLDETYAGIVTFLKEKTRPVLYAILIPWAIFYLATFYSPVIHRDGKVFSYTGRGSSFLKFANYDPDKATALESSIYLKKYMDELLTIIKSNTRADEIIYCNYNYIAGMLYAFSGRAISDGMLNEIKPIYYSDPAIMAALIVWIKNPEGVFEPELKSLIDRLSLVKIAETKFAYLYRNPVVIAHKIVPRPAVPSNIAFLILLAWISAIFICIIRRY